MVYLIWRPASGGNAQTSASVPGNQRICCHRIEALLQHQLYLPHVMPPEPCNTASCSVRSVEYLTNSHPIEVERIGIEPSVHLLLLRLILWNRG